MVYDVNVKKILLFCITVGITNKPVKMQIIFVVKETSLARILKKRLFIFPERMGESMAEVPLPAITPQDIQVCQYQSSSNLFHFSPPPQKIFFLWFSFRNCL
jgi:hypothetical protein